MAKRSTFIRHLVEMFVVMQAGMAVGPFLFALACTTSVSELARDRALQLMLVMAFSMTAPMVAWMLHRGHSRRSAAEMAAVMLAPALPLIVAKATGVVGGPVCGAYCFVATLAMVALIVVRRDAYRSVAATPVQPISTEGVV